MARQRSTESRKTKLGRSTGGRKIKPFVATIAMNHQIKDGNSYLYARLRWRAPDGKRKETFLGPVDPFHPTALLDTVLREAEYLSFDELYCLRFAPKQQREVFKSEAV